MSKNIFQVFTANPITSNANTDLMYFGQSPYGAGDDAAMTFANFKSQFGAPYTASALTEVNDTNVTLTLGGTPATSLLEPVSLTMGWAGQLSPARGGTGVNNATNTLTLAGNLATSGAFASTFTMTGPTTVTFPTSGTLLTSAGAVTSISGTSNQISASASTGAVTLSISNNPILPGTGGTTLPTGNTAARAGGAGTMRFNSQTSVFEGTVDGSTWAAFETALTGVLTVSGTLNRITSTGGVTPVIDISASYVGQSSITTLGTIGTGVWNGTVITGTYGGTGVNNGASTITLGGSLTTSGAFASTFTMTNTTNVTFPTSGTLATTSQIPSGAALTKTDDTNVTLTLGGSPTTALVNAASITAGWTGTLALTRGGTAASLTASNGGIIYSTASTLAVLGGTSTANQLLVSGASTTPAWTTSTYPTTNAANTLLYASSANTMAALATANSSGLLTNGSGVPGWVTATGTGSPVLSASPTFTGTPLIGASPYSVGIITPWVAYTPTFTGFGTVSAVQIWSSRVGNSLHIRGVFTSGTATAVEARMTLGFNGSNSNVTSSSTLITNIQAAGGCSYSQTGVGQVSALIESNTGYITFSLQNNTNGGLTKATGSNLLANGNSMSILAEIPIDTWP